MESLMRCASTAMVGLAFVLLGGGVVGARAGALPSEPLISCERIVLHTRSGTEDGYRVLLGTVALPGARHLAGASTTERARYWRYYRNAGIAIRAGTSTVSVSVPEGWRNRVAVSWGDSPAASALRFSPCGRSPAGTWNSYSGGFHLRARGDCVPLIVRVGGLSTTVRVGVGRACG